MKFLKLLCITLMFFCFWATCHAQTTAFSHQGKLNVDSAPANGNYDFEFKLFDAVSGGAQQGSTVQQLNVAVANGIYSVSLDFGAGALSGADRFLEVAVRAAGGGAFTVLTPRQNLLSTPYAVKSINATTATNATNATNATTATNATQLNGQTASFYQNAANISAGTLNAARLPVPLTLSGTSSTHIIRGENASTTTFSSAVLGLASAASGATYGVLGLSNSTSGWGGFFQGRGPEALFVENLGSGRGIQVRASSDTAIWGLTTTGLAGVDGANASTSGRGVSGYASATSGTTSGVWGQSSSTDGRGVFGLATAGSGTTYGVRGDSASIGGFGVYGLATATSGLNFGIGGQTDSSGGTGVAGLVNNTSGTNYGVHGDTFSETNGYGVFSSGRFGASGTKSFRIDHPDDPANKYLLHYATESPEVINFYSGMVTLDKRGEAVVELPAYFAKINKDPRYMLTAVGAPMPALHVAKEIDEAALSAGAKLGPGETAAACSFLIAGGAPGAKVSWRVEAIRNDKWIQQRPASVEVEKEGGEKGTYQHPELYGQPKEKRMNYNVPRKT